MHCLDINYLWQTPGLCNHQLERGLSSNQNRYTNPCQHHQELPSGISSKNCPGQILYLGNFNVLKRTDVSKLSAGIFDKKNKFCLNIRRSWDGIPPWARLFLFSFSLSDKSFERSLCEVQHKRRLLVVQLGWTKLNRSRISEKTLQPKRGSL